MRLELWRLSSQACAAIADPVRDTNGDTSWTQGVAINIYGNYLDFESVLWKSFQGREGRLGMVDGANSVLSVILRALISQHPFGLLYLVGL
jgi:hypothetical protein